MTRRNPRRPAARILAARWALVASGAAVLAAAALIGTGAVRLPAPVEAPAAHPCHVIAYATTDHAVICSDGRSFTPASGMTVQGAR